MKRIKYRSMWAHASGYTRECGTPGFPHRGLVAVGRSGVSRSYDFSVDEAVFVFRTRLIKCHCGPDLGRLLGSPHPIQRHGRSLDFLHQPTPREPSTRNGYT